MRPFALLVLAALAAPACGKSDADRPPGAEPTINAKTSHLVPLFGAFKWQLQPDATLPVIDQTALIAEAIAYILEYEEAEPLRTEDDRKAMRLLRDYLDGSRALNLKRSAVTDGRGNPGRLAYLCRGDIYVIALHIRSSIPSLALGFYHEAQHAVRCQAQLAELGLGAGSAGPSLDTDPCKVEPPAYAGAARLLQAMILRGAQPMHASPFDPGDSDSLRLLYEAWRALSEDGFCTWIRSVQPQE